MSKITFFPLGCADTTLVELNDERSILVDYCHREDVFDLKGTLAEYLEKKGVKSFDVVAFTHAHQDHVQGLEDFFWLEYAKKYQADDRPKIRELWVPAVLVTDTNLSDSATIIQKEAKYRLKNGTGIRVFGSTETLEEWLVEAEVTTNVQRAGQLVNGFSKEKGGVEIFVHSPFSFKMNEDEDEKNDNSIVLHMTFFESECETRFMIGADAEHGTWENIVYITEREGNEKRLEWDIFGISHHCSFTALSDEKGERITKPTPSVEKLMLKGGRNAILVASCDSIPTMDTTLPPHFQAAAYYKDLAKAKGSKDNFFVTMEYPDLENPQPIVLDISPYGAKVKASSIAPAAFITATSTPQRFG